MSDYGQLKHRAQRLAERLCETAQKRGAQAADATCGFGSSLSAKARDGEVEDITRSSSNGAGVRVIVDGKLGFATSAAAPQNDDDIERLCQQAIDLAKIATPSEHNVIPAPTAPTDDELDATVKTLGLYDETTAEASPDWAIDNAIVLARVVQGTPGIETVREVSAAAGKSVFALATSTGFAGSYGGTSAHLYAGAVAKDGDKNQVDGWWVASRRMDQLDDPEAVARRATTRALARCGAKKVPTTKAAVVFDPDMARTFLGAVLSGIDGERVAKQASFLGGKQGEAVFIPGHALRDVPLLAGALGSRPFDGEGQKVTDATLIDDQGVLQSYLLDARSASELSLPLTGHAGRGATGRPGPSISNIVIDGGEGSLDDIVADTARGLLVTHLMGHSPDMITGEYSRGAAGFWIEDGQIVHPVEEITIAGDMLDMMRGIDRVGADADLRSSVRAPTIRFAQLTISGS